MGALETAKDIARLTVTATLSSEVIALLKEKAGLLAEQVTTLETENSDLKKKVGNLEQELEHLRPKQDRLEEGAEKILQLLFDSDPQPLYPGVMAQSLGIKEGVVKYHCDVLCEELRIGFGGMGNYYLLEKGRAYVVKRLLRE